MRQIHSRFIAALNAKFRTYASKDKSVRASTVYATLLPTGLVKVGFARTPSRPLEGQTWFAEPLQVLAIWPAARGYEDESDAHRWLRTHGLWVRGELFKVPTADWLTVGHPIVDLLSEVLGPPLQTEFPLSLALSRGRPVKGE